MTTQPLHVLPLGKGVSVGDLTQALAGKVDVTGYSGEKAFRAVFPGAANEKIDLYFAGSGPVFFATIDVTLTGYFSGANASGTLRAVYSLSGNNAGGSNVNRMDYTVVQGTLPDHFALSPATWDAVNNRWRITIAHRTTSGNSVSALVKWQANTAANSDALRDSIGLGAVYTTDVSAPTSPVVLSSPTSPYAAKTGAYTITGTDSFIAADATAAPFTVTLPTAVGKAGTSYSVIRVNSGSNAVTVGTTSAQTIDGATTYVLTVPRSSVEVVSDGANWRVVNSKTRAGDGIDPDMFTGTDFQKIQAAVDYSITNNYPAIVFYREFDITGQGSILIEKNPWYDRRVLWLLGQGGGIKKTDAGAMLSSSTRNTGDVSARNMRFLSTSGAGAAVWDCDKLIRISSMGNDYRSMDWVARSTGSDIVNRFQSTTFVGDHIIGGTGHAFRAPLTYDLAIAYCLVEDRTGGLFTNAVDATTTQNYALKIVGNVVENCIGTAPDGAPLKIAKCDVATIEANYFEANHVNTAVPDVDFHTLCGSLGHRSVSYKGNIHSRSTFQMANNVASVWVGRTSTPIVSASNLAYGILYDLKMAVGSLTAPLGSITALGSDYSSTGRPYFRAFHADYYTSPSINAAPPSGNTAARPISPRLYQNFFDTTLGKTIWCSGQGTRPQQSITISNGATTSGNITVTLAGASAASIPVTAGDTIEQVVDKIVATTIAGWTAYKYLTTRAVFVKDTAETPGVLPVFDGGTTGVTQSLIQTEVVYAAPTWVTADGVNADAPLAAKTAAYTMTGTDSMVTADATGGAFTITLPTAIGKIGKRYTIKRVNGGSNVVTVATTSSQTIDGAATYALASAQDVLKVVSDSANWRVVVEPSVRLSGDQTIAGIKTFSSEPVVPSLKVAGTAGAVNPGRFVGVTTAGAPTSGTYEVGDFVLTKNGNMFVCVIAGTPGAWVSPRDQTELLATGQEAIPRHMATSITTPISTSGVMRFTYFTARKSEISTQVRMYSGSTAAGATPTVARIGLYTVDTNGDLALVASTANDTALFAAANTAYVRSWSTPYSMVAGQRYAIAPLVVSGAAIPTFVGLTIGNSTETAMPPRLSAAISGQADLPATVTAGSLTSNGSLFYAALLP